MSEVLSRSECIEVDITYKSCIELPYLFNVVAFNYITMRCKCLCHACLCVCVLINTLNLSVLLPYSSIICEKLHVIIKLCFKSCI